MNDEFRALKERLRRLDALLQQHGTGDAGFTQALSLLHRAARRGDRSRRPTAELAAMLERVEALGRGLA